MPLFEAVKAVRLLGTSNLLRVTVLSPAEDITRESSTQCMSSILNSLFGISDKYIE